MLVRVLLPMAIALLAATGCGGSAGDLLAVKRSGTVPGAELQVIITDAGFASCNEADELRLPEELLLDAREVERDLETAAEEQLSLNPGDGSIFSYEVETPTGIVRFADTSSGRVEGMDELAFLVRQVAQDVCGLPR